MATRRAPRALIIIQNLPVPFDRRVWLECNALRNAGYEVTVICPKGKGDPKYQVIDGIRVYKYRAFPPIQSQLAFPLEYLYSFLNTLWLTAKVRVKHGFDVIQACNPPDIFFPIARLAALVGKAKFVFDQHDLCPELYESRFPDGATLPHKGLLAIERATYAAAHHVIATNGSYRAVAMRRGGKRADEVTIVRTGPDPQKLRRGDPKPELRRGRQHLVAYIGVMGPQDGVDIAIRAAAVIRHEMGRTDVAFTLIGSGDSFDELVELARALDVNDIVDFTGRAPDDLVIDIMSTADLGLSPDPKNPLNDVSTMNKTMEYMAFELPVVAFDLVETKVSAADAAVYAEPNDVRAYAKAIIELIDDPERRRAMAELGRRRVEDVLAWEHQAPHYVGVYDRLVGRSPRVPLSVG